MPGAVAQTGMPSVTRADRVRERELFRYYRPPNPLDHDNQIPLPQPASAERPATSPDVFLTALAQLVTLRLDVKRCIISVIDRDTSYVISESTRTLSLTDTTRSEGESDGLFMGCSTINRLQSMCQHVLELADVPNGHPFSIIPDLAEDLRFCDRPFVTGPPCFRFYAATPLRSERGVYIGVIAAIDDRPRSRGLDASEQDFLACISSTVMEQLAMRREAEERKKVSHISHGLSAFVERRSRLTVQKEPYQPMNYTKVNHVSVPQTNGVEASKVGVVGEPNEAQTMVQESGDDDDSGSDQNSVSQDGSGLKTPNQSFEQAHTQTLTRAANLLRESFNLHNGGGVVFLDATFGFSSQNVQSTADPQEQNNVQTSENATYSVLNSLEASDMPVDVLAQSLTPRCHESDSNAQVDTKFYPMSQSALQKILKRYPRGKLWTFDEELNLSSSEEDQLFEQVGSNVVDDMWRRPRKNRQAEARVLQECFPGVRCLLMAPLWDTTHSKQSSAGFCFTTSNLHSFSQEPDLSFLIAFSDSITAETSRLANIDAEKKKADFIGSISHELRSPLHGILASAEFLAETECSSFQTSLIDTIDICGRTLLDTINNVLEFSRINAYEKTWKKSRKLKSYKNALNNFAEKPNSRLPELLAVSCQTDVAAITEEVVEGIFAGHLHSSFSSTDPSDQNANKANRDLVNITLPVTSAQKDARNKVKIALDFEDQDYVFMTQPGALRRVIMNLFTNSLKYTDAGTITIKLRLQDIIGTDDITKGKGKMLVLIVQDTGRGIATSYLRTRLFTPFTQENSLSPGTGLGLSLVRSIVTMLGGNVNIQSQLGRGTIVQVQIPMVRHKSTPKSTPSSASLFQRPRNDCVEKLKALVPKRIVALYGFDMNESSPVRDFETIKALKTYIVAWYGLHFTTTFGESDIPDVIIVDQRDEESLLRLIPDGSPISVIVLCDTLSDRTTVHHRILYVSRPFGPYKLAKAVHVCIERTANDSLQSTKDVPKSLPELEQIPPISELSSLTINAMEDKSPVVAHSGSENAQTAVGTTVEEGEQSAAGFPFPEHEVINDEETTAATNDLARQRVARHPIVGRKTDSVLEIPRDMPPQSTIVKISEVGEETVISPLPPPTPAPAPEPERRAPRILLVEDNSVNMMLLKTFMRKRKYIDIDEAVNGQQAIDAARVKSYDIVFMDISMPIKNGFEATREIRRMEAAARKLATRRLSLGKTLNPTTAGWPEGVVDSNGALKTAQEEDAATAAAVAANPPSPALIIALTGLASSQDQREAFVSGVDLFMTKPVSFKEVAKLLDNWEANGWKREDS